MNKIITVYDLLGLIKEGKAPKKIEYQGNILEFDKEDYKFYVGADVLSDDSLVKYISVGNLNEKVEILEEDKPIIEKLNLDREPLRGREVPRAIDYLLEGRINEIIEFLSRKEDK